MLAEIETRSQTALALEACGVARLALEDALEYASSREQFGKKIGVYQAVSHPLADAYTRIELSRSLALWAAWCVATDDPQASIAAAAAKSYAGESAVAVCETAIQSLGGIGFTWEHRLHRLYKRALGIESFGRSRHATAGGDRRDAHRRRRRRGPRARPRTPGHRSHKEADVDGLMMDYQLNVPAILRRADELYGDNEIASRLPDKSWHRYTYADFVSRTKKLIVALRKLGLEDGDRVGTFMWNHSQHLEAYMGAPVGGFVTHTLNLRLHPDDNTYIATHGGDRVLIVDKVLWPLRPSSSSLAASSST